MRGVLGVVGISVLLALPAAAGARGQAGPWEGTWNTTYGELKLTQSGSSVTGADNYCTTRVSGTTSGNVLRGRWTQVIFPCGGTLEKTGFFEFTLSSDRASFSGRWRYSSQTAWFKAWNGTRVGGPPPAKSLELVGYPCGDDTARVPQTVLYCSKRDFQVLLVALFDNGNGSLPSGTTVSVEQAPQGGSFAASPPACSSPPTKVNCRNFFDPSNKAGRRVGFHGPEGTWMFYRATLRNAAGAIVQTSSKAVAVYWTNQSEEEGNLELVGYPCGDDAARVPQSVLHCSKRDFQVLLVALYRDGNGSLPAGTTVSVEQAPQGGAYAATPPGCANPARPANCRNFLDGSNKAGRRVGFQGRDTWMYYRATLRNAAGAIVKTSRQGVAVFWSNQGEDEGKLELVGYPCGDDAARVPQAILHCSKRDFQVLLVALYNDGKGSLPAGTKVSVEQAPEGGSFAASPPPCANPAPAVNCRNFSEASNKAGRRIGYHGRNKWIFYRATLRDASGAILLTSSKGVAVSWTYQPGSEKDPTLEVVGYPCGDDTARVPQTVLYCSKRGFQVLLVALFNNGDGSLPAGTQVSVEQTPEGGVFGIAPPACSSPPTAVNCRNFFDPSNKAGHRVGFSGPQKWMFYRVTLRNSANGIVQTSSRTVAVFWSNQG